VSPNAKIRLIVWVMLIRREVLLLAAAAVKVLKRLKVLQ